MTPGSAWTGPGSAWTGPGSAWTGPDSDWTGSRRRRNLPGQDASLFAAPAPAPGRTTTQNWHVIRILSGSGSELNFCFAQAVGWMKFPTRH